MLNLENDPFFSQPLMLCTFKLGQTFKLQALFQEAEVVSDVNTV